MAARRGRDEGVEPWPPSREALAAAFAGGQTLAMVGRRHGRSPASVSLLAARYGLATARAAGRLARPRPAAAPDRAWPPSDAVIGELAAAGVGDGRAAALFSVHPSTYRAWRRRLRDRTAGCEPAEVPGGDGPSYGHDPAARWPAWARFADDARATDADRTGRVVRPPTIVEGASSLAAVAG
ncbi:hypothetical protein [Stella sp.]|uniref:hypothetical protein n=1 Tax=Stella sp. TaxID=2912054 RepID=UPI0035AE2F94